MISDHINSRRATSVVVSVAGKNECVYCNEAIPNGLAKLDIKYTR